MADRPHLRFAQGERPWCRVSNTEAAAGFSSRTNTLGSASARCTRAILTAVDRFDRARKVCLACGAQRFAFNRPARTHRQRGEHGIAAGLRLGQTLAGEHHLRFVQSVGIDRQRTACRIQANSRYPMPASASATAALSASASPA
jgi:hypothetical protein